MILPAPLQPGDTIAIVATARKVSPEEMQPAIEILKNWGLKVVAGPNLYKQHKQFAGSDVERAEDLQWALDNVAIKAVLFARGGYGTVRIIEAIDFSSFKNNPKWLIGFSDITVLHSHIHSQLGVATLHAPMAINFVKTPEAVLAGLKQMLFGNFNSVSCPAQLLNRTGNAKGVLVGGNLSLLYALSGTPSDINTNGKILFIEDLDEYLYHMDRMMMQLKHAGKLKKLAGLVVGGMSDMKDNTVPFGKTAEQIIAEHVAEFSYPVCFDFPAGHLVHNHSLVFGGEVFLEVNAETRLDFMPLA